MEAWAHGCSIEGLRESASMLKEEKEKAASATGSSSAYACL